MLKIDDIKQWHPKQSWTRRAFIDSVKKAFEEIFKVKVDKINTMITREGKKKAFIKLKKEYSAADVAVKLGMI